MHNVPQASFDIDSPLAVPLPEPLSSAREEVLDALDQLHALLLGSLPYLMRLTSPAVIIYCFMNRIYLIKLVGEYHEQSSGDFSLQRSQNLKLDEKNSYEELAKRCHLSSSDLRRFFRLATANHVFLESQTNIVAHSAISRILDDISDFTDWIDVVCKEMWPVSTRCLEAMIKWPGSDAPAHTGFALSSGTGGSFFQEIGKDPKRASRFANAMALIQSTSSLNVSFLTDNLNWTDSACPSSIIDVGGS